jgi:phytoene synthase
MNPALAQSYQACEAIARRAASSFYPAFRLLPPPQRRAMCAIYAFLRIADDISDEPAAPEHKCRQLQEWRDELDRTLAGAGGHDISAALHDCATRFAIPSQYLSAALDGVAMDLAPAVYATFADLHNYCYHVASVVGLACIHIWGFRGDRAEEFAINAGIAFQLTNILRDLREDAARGRVYLPAEDLRRFAYPVDKLSRGERDTAFRELMAFQVARARGFYDAAWPLVPLLNPAGRSVFLVMARTYRALLDEMEKRDFDVFTSRVRVSRWRKIIYLARSVPARWGWNMGGW